MASALILAAGRGERLRPLTDHRPKPLLVAGGRALVEWQVESLVRGGFTDLVVNHAHLGAMIEETLGDGTRFGARIRYSAESPALETAGGIVKALRARIERIAAEPAAFVAHLVLVDNPSWHAAGDMGLAGGRITREGPRLTYGNIGVFHPAMFAGIAPGTHLKLFPWAYRFVDEGRVSGERYTGAWDNVGTAAQLAALDERLAG